VAPEAVGTFRTNTTTTDPTGPISVSTAKPSSR
jgi:hypothetical protein